MVDIPSLSVLKVLMDDYIHFFHLESLIKTHKTLEIAEISNDIRLDQGTGRTTSASSCYYMIDDLKTTGSISEDPLMIRTSNEVQKTLGSLVNVPHYFQKTPKRY